MPIQGYELQYLVSDKGRIKNRKTDKLLKISTSKEGYARITLSKNGNKKTFAVHRLVAMCFLPNQDGLPEVNHKNEKRLDNRVSNLEWCDRAYNVNFGNRTKRQKAKVSKPVIQMSKDGTRIARFPSTVQAGEETGLNHHRIADCCRGERKSTGGYRWSYQRRCKRE